MRLRIFLILPIVIAAMATQTLASEHGKARHNNPDKDYNCTGQDDCYWDIKVPAGKTTIRVWCGGAPLKDPQKFKCHLNVLGAKCVYNGSTCDCETPGNSKGYVSVTCGY